ncbi:hypothetical protein GCM10010420_00720 [Streptomyces glaucosporus]|uniref:Uncharacterized protein n=1 Tax=Streptomyces glaucosporus TaxID=284044 RepID=A0ABN3HKI4_9ACTN
MERLYEAAVRLALGEQPAEELPMVAAGALARGVDGPALRALAGLSRHDPSVELFREAMDELGAPVPAPREARLWRMRRTAEAAVAGRRGPRPASDEIYWSACRLDRSPFAVEVTDRFLGLCLAWDEHPAERPAVEEAMREAFRDLLRRLPPGPGPGHGRAAG